jgi:SAM-dependent methyltransferase
VTQADAERLPFGDATFDLVVLADVIEHVSSVGQAMREVRRVLRPGGRLVCVTPVRATLAGWRLADRMARAIVRSGGAATTAHRDSAVIERFLSKRELRDAVVRAGLRPVSFRRVCFYPAPETAGAFGAIMRRRYRRSPVGFGATADRAIRAFDVASHVRLLNQKQLWVARR